MGTPKSPNSGKKKDGSSVVSSERLSDHHLHRSSSVGGEIEERAKRHVVRGVHWPLLLFICKAGIIDTHKHILTSRRPPLCDMHASTFPTLIKDSSSPAQASELRHQRERGERDECRVQKW